MIISFGDFNPPKFSFHQDPILVLENFWNKEDMDLFRDEMNRSSWNSLSTLPHVSRAFPNCGNWLKAEISPSQAGYFLNKLSMISAITDYVESFPAIKARHVNFNYYSYGVGDCLSTHDDTDEGYALPGQGPPPLRRLALATYFHADWHPDWGGELIIYKKGRENGGQGSLEIDQCIAPKPGTVAIFAVPRFHRVCRVDALAADHKRLSIAGWFMTEHFS